MKQKTAAIILACVAALTSFQSCDNSNDGNSISVYQNIVTFLGNDGNNARFEYQEADDSPIVVLGIRGNLDMKKVNTGQRLLMLYSLPEGTSYGQHCSEVELRGLQFIYEAEATPLPYSQIETLIKPIYLNTLYRTGNYLNFSATMPAIKKRSYSLLVDETTVGEAEIVAYITTAVEKDSLIHNETQYGSFDISPVWELPSTRSLTVNIENSNNKYLSSITFNKAQKAE